MGCVATVLVIMFHLWNLRAHRLAFGAQYAVLEELVRQKVLPPDCLPPMPSWMGE